MSCGISLHSLHRQNQTPARSKKHGNRPNGKRLRDFATRSRKWPTVRSIRPSTNTTQRVQNSAARLVTKTMRREHITPAMIELRWLSVRQRIEYKLLLFTFNSLHGLAAPYLAELLSRHQPTRSLRYADAHLLVEPRSNLKTQDDRAFSHAAPCLWNNLPLAMGVTDSQKLFKNQLKTILFKRAFVFKLLH